MIGTQVRTLDPSLKGNSDPSREVSYTGQYTHYCLRLVYDLPTHHVARSCHPPRLRSSGLRRTHQEGSVVAHIERSNTTHRTMPLSGAHAIRILPPHIRYVSPGNAGIRWLMHTSIRITAHQLRAGSTRRSMSTIIGPCTQDGSHTRHHSYVHTRVSSASPCLC